MKDHDALMIVSINVTGFGKISNITKKFKIELNILRYRSKLKEQNDISISNNLSRNSAMRCWLEF